RAQPWHARPPPTGRMWTRRWPCCPPECTRAQAGGGGCGLSGRESRWILDHLREPDALRLEGARAVAQVGRTLELASACRRPPLLAQRANLPIQLSWGGGHAA